MIQLNETVPAGIDPDFYHESEVSHIIGVGSLYVGVTIVAVGLRFLSRWSVRAGFWWDDWFALVTLVSDPSPSAGGAQTATSRTPALIPPFDLELC